MDHALIMWNIILEGNIHKLKWRCNSSNKDTWTSLAFALNMNVFICKVLNLFVKMTRIKGFKNPTN
jgi:hypothetical protein